MSSEYFLSNWCGLSLATEPGGGGGQTSTIVSQLMRHLPDMLNMFVNNVATVAYWGMQVSGENNNR